MVTLRRLCFRRFSSALPRHELKHEHLHSKKLSNNMMVVTKGPETELISFNVSIGAGSRYELPSVPGLAHCFKHSLFMVL